MGRNIFFLLGLTILFHSLGIKNSAQCNITNVCTNWMYMSSQNSQGNVFCSRALEYSKEHNTSKCVEQGNIRSLYLQKNWAEIVSELDALGKRAELDELSSYYLAKALWEVGDSEKAISYLWKVGAYQDLIGWFLKNGYLKIDQGKYYQARESFASMLEAARQSNNLYSVSEAWRGIGTSYWKLGLRNRAVSSYQEGIAAFPTNGILWQYYGQALLEDGRCLEAESAFIKALDTLSADSQGERRNSIKQLIDDEITKCSDE